MASDVQMDEQAQNRERALALAIEKLTLRGRTPAAEERRPLSVSRIVLALDDTPGSKVALRWARAIATATGASVRVVTVVIPPHVAGYDGGGYAWWPQVALELDRTHDVERTAHEAAIAELEHAGLRADGVMLSGSPVAEIARIANAYPADLVILGSHNRTAMGRALLGSVADGVKNHVEASVLIAKAEPPPERILIAVDGSPASKSAAGLATRLAAAWGADATVLHVLDLGGAHPSDDALRSVVSALPTTPSPPRVSYALVPGAPAQRIVDEARDRGAGLIVMGSRGLGRLRSLVSGSVSSKVAHLSPVSVLLVKEVPA